MENQVKFQREREINKLICSKKEIFLFIQIRFPGFALKKSYINIE